MFWLQWPHYFEYAETVKVVNTCEFDFSTFPFDSHTCDWDFGDAQYETYAVLFEKAVADFKGNQTSDENPHLKITRPRLAFDIDLEAKEPFEHHLALVDETYSNTGLRYF